MSMRDPVIKAGIGHSPLIVFINRLWHGGLWHRWADVMLLERNGRNAVSSLAVRLAVALTFISSFFYNPLFHFSLFPLETDDKSC
jgi:hypothetical protein